MRTTNKKWTATTAVVGAGLAMALPALAQAKSFHEYLTEDYATLAVMEMNQGDIVDPKIFSDKSAALAHGKTVEPMMLKRSKYTDQAYAKLENARASLMTALNNGAKEKTPEAASSAQSYFDCWAVHEQVAYDAEHNLLSCEDHFNNAMAMVGTYDITKEPRPQPVAYTGKVHFAWDSAELSPSAQRELAAVADYIRREEPSVVYIQGFADRSGPEEYNQDLSRARAVEVAAYLNQRIENMPLIEVAAYGEHNLPDPTADGVIEADNRVARFYFRAQQ